MVPFLSFLFALNRAISQTYYLFNFSHERGAQLRQIGQIGLRPAVLWVL
jgi:hypothetical protein